jgi:hypothetical protein
MSRLLRQVALVSEVQAVGFSELTRVAAALNKQVSRDFGPIWDIEATVDPFVRLEDVPLGYWPIIVEADIGNPRAGGYHTDKDGQPLALVKYDDSWALTSSHECLEMLADPFGNRLIAGQSKMSGQGRVEFLVEVCDPSEDAAFGYTVNDITVSDFYTPNFFDPKRGDGVRYSFTGAITEPRQVLNNGYLSWHNPQDDHWYQETVFGGVRDFPDLGIFSASDARSLREIVDSKTRQPFEILQGRASVNAMMGARRPMMERGMTASSPKTKVDDWRALIKSLKGGSATGGGGPRGGGGGVVGRRSGKRNK